MRHKHKTRNNWHAAGHLIQTPSAPDRTDHLAAARKAPGERLEVTCWCEAETVRVPVEEVRAGRTRSCGAEGCKG